MDPSDGHSGVEVAGARRPVRGQHACGDAWAQVTGRNGCTLLALFDGLGHGESAALAADTATDIVQRQALEDGRNFDLPNLMSELDRALRQTRGAVASIVLIEPKHRLLRFAGVGNIEGYVLGLQPVRLVPRFGMIGSGSVRLTPPQVVEFPPEALLVLHTDGIAGVAPPKIPRLRSCATVAHFMLAEWGRPDDDAAAVVARLHDQRPVH